MNARNSFRVVVLDPKKAGKSSLSRFFKGMSFSAEYKDIECCGLVRKEVVVSDDQGQETKTEIALIEPPSGKKYTDRIHLVLCCFDATDPASLEEAVRITTDAYQDVSPKPLVVLVATKMDKISKKTPVIADALIINAIASLTDAFGKEHVHQQPYPTSAAAKPGEKYYQETQDFLNQDLPRLCKASKERMKAEQEAQATFFTLHPHVSMELLITGLALGIALISLATVATCGVAGLLGAGIAAIAATATFGASLSTVGLVAGGVGLFGGLGIAGASYLIHTKARPALEGSLCLGKS